MITEREIFLTDPEEKAKVVEFLKGFDLTFTGIIDYTMGLFDDGKLIGTGSLGGRVMRDIAISSDYQRKGLTHRIIRNLQGEVQPPRDQWKSDLHKAEECTGL